MRLASSDVFQAGPEHPGRVLDVHAEKAGHHNDNHDHADDVENIHCLAPIEDCENCGNHFDAIIGSTPPARLGSRANRSCVAT